MAETIVKIVVMKADGTTAEKTTELKFDGDTKDAVTMVEALEKGKKFHAHYVIDNGKIIKGNWSRELFNRSLVDSKHADLEVQGLVGVGLGVKFAEPLGNMVAGFIS